MNATLVSEKKQVSKRARCVFLLVTVNLFTTYYNPAISRGGQKVFLFMGGKNRRQKCWAAKECFQLWVAKELGGKNSRRQKSVFYCGWQKSWAAKECLIQAHSY